MNRTLVGINLCGESIPISPTPLQPGDSIMLQMDDVPMTLYTEPDPSIRELRARSRSYDFKPTRRIRQFIYRELHRFTQKHRARSHDVMWGIERKTKVQFDIGKPWATFQPDRMILVLTADTFSGRVTEKLELPNFNGPIALITSSNRDRGPSVFERARSAFVPEMRVK